MPLPLPFLTSQMQVPNQPEDAIVVINHRTFPFPLHAVKRERCSDPQKLIHQGVNDPVTFQLDYFEHIQPSFVKYFWQDTCRFPFPLHAVKRERVRPKIVAGK